MSLQKRARAGNVRPRRSRSSSVAHHPGGRPRWLAQGGVPLSDGYGPDEDDVEPDEQMLADGEYDQYDEYDEEHDDEYSEDDAFDVETAPAAEPDRPRAPLWLTQLRNPDGPALPSEPATMPASEYQDDEHEDGAYGEPEYEGREYENGAYDEADCEGADDQDVDRDAEAQDHEVQDAEGVDELGEDEVGEAVAVETVPSVQPERPRAPVWLTQLRNPDGQAPASESVPDPEPVETTETTAISEKAEARPLGTSLRVAQFRSPAVPAVPAVVEEPVVVGTPVRVPQFRPPVAPATVVAAAATGRSVRVPQFRPPVGPAAVVAAAATGTSVWVPQFRMPDGPLPVPAPNGTSIWVAQFRAPEEAMSPEPVEPTESQDADRRTAPVWLTQLLEPDAADADLRLLDRTDPEADTVADEEAPERPAAVVVPPPATSDRGDTAEGHPGRWWLAGLLAAAVAVAATVWWTTRPDPAPTRHQERVQLAAAKAPVPVQPDTAYVRTRVLPSGDLRVSHWLHLRDDAVSLTLAIPRVAGLASSQVGVRDVVLASDGVRDARANAEQQQGETTYFLPPGKDLYVSYTLTGVVSQDDVGGRGLARLTALDVTPSSPLRHITQTFSGAAVLALACSQPGSALALQPCGTERDGTWQVELPAGGRSDQVMAQVDLSAQP